LPLCRGATEGRFGGQEGGREKMGDDDCDECTECLENVCDCECCDGWTEELGEYGTCGVCLGIVALIVTSVLLALSVAVCPPNFVALDYNSFNLEVGNKVIKNGRHWVGLGHTLLLFPTTLQSVSFGGRPLLLPSQEGQIVEMEVAFQYRLITEGKCNVNGRGEDGDLECIRNLYNAFKMDWEQRYESIAESAFKGSSASFTVAQFYTARKAINAAMFEALRDKFKDNGAVLEGLQMLKMTPPASVDVAYINKVVAEQQVRTSTLLQEVRKVEAATLLIAGNTTAQTNLINVKAEAQAERDWGDAEARGIGDVLAAEATALKNARNGLSMTNVQMLRYLWGRAVREDVNASVVVTSSAADPVDLMLGLTSGLFSSAGAAAGSASFPPH